MGLNGTVLTAREIMRPRSSLTVLRPEHSIISAIELFTKHKISGAPVVDDKGDLVGVLSELDCLRELASDEFYDVDQFEERTVGDLMSTTMATVDASMDIYGVADHFVSKGVRRLPVMEGGRLIGQVSRRDVLDGVRKMHKKRTTKKIYPDYPRPPMP